MFNSPKAHAAIMLTSAAAQALVVYNVWMKKPTHGVILGVAGIGAAYELYAAGKIAYAALMPAAPAAQ